MTASTSTRKAAVAFTVIVMAACAIALTVNAGERTRGGCGRWGALRSSQALTVLAQGLSPFPPSSRKILSPT
jgi:hypothetical protein